MKYILSSKFVKTFFFAIAIVSLQPARAYDNPPGVIVGPVSTSDAIVSNEGTIYSRVFDVTGINSTGTSSNIAITNSESGYINLSDAGGGTTGINTSSNSGTSTVVTNSGLIKAAQNNLNGVGDSFTNNVSGTMVITAPGASVQMYQPNQVVTNAGLITGMVQSASGINVQSSNETINNSGVISVSGNSATGIWVLPGGVASITNTSSIFASTDAPNTYGILNEGSIAVLRNSQGVGNGYGALSYAGNLPTNYNIIINGQSSYGQIYIPTYSSGITGTTSFGINPGSFISGSYGDVLQNFDAANINPSSLNGSSGHYTWALSPNPDNVRYWNLLIASSIYGAGTIYQSSNLGSTVNPIFDGGTLQVTNGYQSIGSAFIVNTANGVIDQNGLTSTFSGVISDAVSGAPGSMTITNSGNSGGSVIFTENNSYTGSTNINSGATLSLSGSGSIATSSNVIDNGTFDISATTSGTSIQAISGAGTTALGAKTLAITNASGNLSGVVTGTGGLNIIGGSQTLSGANTFSGGVQVQSAASLSISSANALGSGALALIGSVTVPATLNITDTTAIANAITVAGYPVFNITTGTTTTISSPIADGGSAGGVVVSGGGTLNLTAVNTYKGLTAIGAGSTLALSGTGSITPSVAVTNSGTFNMSSQTGNVALGGTFAQTSNGSLVMGFSPTSNQRLQIAGTAVLAGSLSLQATNGTYSAGKYTLLSANGVSGKFGTFSSNINSYTNLAYALGYDANDVYLIFTPNTADTQQSLVNASQALQNTFTLQNTVLANSFSYDCTEFGINNVCISAGGRNTAVSAANGLNNTSGLLIAAYRPHQNYRIGAYIDQNLSVNNAGSTVNLGNNTPLIGLFGAWNQWQDGTGMEVKVSAAYGQKNARVTRQVVGTSEAGSGSSQLSSQGAQLTAKYGFGLTENVIASPYIGVRYTQNNMGGYTEGTSSTVTAPLTYSALNTNATTALAGVGASYKVIPKVTAFASAGVETDTNTANGTYSATGIAGLTPINFNANPVKTRPTATLGAYYDVAKNQRVGITGIYRQEPFQALSTTTVMATYTVGL